ncbi:hypothetical protein PENARI_c136G12001 [Penicillium arizonense]|uniref:Uncharacterized protein n=1 Tax=Penicillium arizonense TaxID=1835702 RepID=A0A1F5L187_PENAI|nr:hypothetical protein PENARI_c136G12001 [Penicillium arizonense]OGE46691.1 hypothetical protein PENARI_c136G12001 [Penicillium arizonense]
MVAELSSLQHGILRGRPSKPQTFTIESSEFYSLLRGLADPGSGTLLEKIEHFINGITQDGFADVLTENATLVRETTALKGRVQELEETQENMKARLDELCKEKQVSTIQDNPVRKRRQCLGDAR